MFYLLTVVKKGVAEAYVATPHYVRAMPHVHHPTSYASATQATSFLMDQTMTAEEETVRLCNSGYFIPNGSNTDRRGVDGKTLPQ